jgi:hypothetical protein
VRKSRKDEERLAAEFGGKRLLQSGARRGSKDSISTEGADLTFGSFWVEHKRTEKESLALKREWLTKVFLAATERLKDPAVIITFEGLRGQAEDWVLLPKQVFKRLIHHGEGT